MSKIAIKCDRIYGIFKEHHLETLLKALDKFGLPANSISLLMSQITGDNLDILESTSKVPEETMAIESVAVGDKVEETIAIESVAAEDKVEEAIAIKAVAVDDKIEETMALEGLVAGEKVEEAMATEGAVVGDQKDDLSLAIIGNLTLVGTVLVPTERLLVSGGLVRNIAGGVAGGGTGKLVDSLLEMGISEKEALELENCIQDPGNIMVMVKAPKELTSAIHVIFESRPSLNVVDCAESPSP